MLNEINIEDFYKNFDEYELIIDARSPKEFNESHLPTAVNLYALSDEEHHEIGEMYVQKSKSDARVFSTDFERIYKKLRNIIQEKF